MISLRSALVALLLSALPGFAAEAPAPTLRLKDGGTIVGTWADSTGPDTLRWKGTAFASPLEGLQRDGLKKALASAISQLPERERMVLALYYNEELNLKEIGEILEVSESGHINTGGFSTIIILITQAFKISGSASSYKMIHKIMSDLA